MTYSGQRGDVNSKGGAGESMHSKLITWAMSVNVHEHLCTFLFLIITAREVVYFSDSVF